MFYMEALWLSRGKTLKSVYDTKPENELFLGTEGEYFPQFSERDRISEFDTGKAHSFKFCGQNPELLIKLESLVFKMYESLNSQSNYFRRHLMLMLKEFQSSFKWRFPPPIEPHKYAGSQYVTNGCQN